MIETTTPNSCTAILEAELDQCRRDAATAASSINHPKLKQTLDELTELRAVQKRREEMVAAIVHQRDVYKELLQNGGGGGGGSNQPQAIENGGGTVVAAGEYEALRHKASEYETYKAESAAERKDLNQKLDAAVAAEADGRTQLKISEGKLALQQQRNSRLQQEKLDLKDELHTTEAKGSEFHREYRRLQQLLQSAEEDRDNSNETKRHIENDLKLAKTSEEIANSDRDRAVAELKEKLEEIKFSAREMERVSRELDAEKANVKSKEQAQVAELKRHEEALKRHEEIEEKERQRASTIEEARRELEKKHFDARAEANASQEAEKLALGQVDALEQKLAEVEKLPAGVDGQVVTTAAAAVAAAGAGAETWADERRSFEVKLIDLESELQEEKKKVVDSNKAVKDAADRLEIYEDTEKDLQQAKKAAEADTSRRVTELKTVEQKNEELQARLAQAGATAAELQRKLEVDRDSLKDQLAGSAGAVVRGKQEISAKEAELEALREHAKDTHNKERAARDDYNTLVQKHAKTSEELQKREAEVDGSRTRCREAESTARTANADADTAKASERATSEAMKAQVAAQEKELREAREENQQLRDKVGSMPEVFSFPRRASGGGGGDAAIHLGDHLVETTAAEGGNGGARASQDVLEELRQKKARERELSGKLAVKTAALAAVEAQRDNLKRDLDYEKESIRKELERRLQVDVSAKTLNEMKSNERAAFSAYSLLETQFGELKAKEEKAQAAVDHGKKARDALEEGKQIAEAKAAAAGETAATATKEKEEYRSKMQDAMNRDAERERLTTRQAELEAEVAALQANKGSAQDKLQQQITALCASAAKDVKLQKGKDGQCVTLATDVAVLQPIVSELNRRAQMAGKRFADAKGLNIEKKKLIDNEQKLVKAVKQAELVATRAAGSTPGGSTNEDGQSSQLQADLETARAAKESAEKELQLVRQKSVSMEGTVKNLQKQNQQLKAGLTQSPAGQASPPAAKSLAVTKLAAAKPAAAKPAAAKPAASKSPAVTKPAAAKPAATKPAATKPKLAATKPAAAKPAAPKPVAAPAAAAVAAAKPVASSPVAVKTAPTKPAPASAKPVRAPPVARCKASPLPQPPQQQQEQQEQQQQSSSSSSSGSGGAFFS